MVNRRFLVAGGGRASRVAGAEAFEDGVIAAGRRIARRGLRVG